MNPLSTAWNALIGFLTDALVAIHNVLEPLFGVEAAWGWAIIALTLIVRVLLLPLAIKQTRSMKGMQAIQPKVKEIQGKYKADRELMRKDPERYQKLKAKQNEELMALYKDEGVNPAASCLPLVLQMPIFFALFRILGVGGLEDLRDAHFYFVTDFVRDGADAIGLGASVSEAGWPGWMLIVLMSASMFITQRQMMSRNSVEGAQATQQKVMMYVFPVFLAVISFRFPLAVVLYWVTTNIWQGVQQYIMFRVTTEGEDAPGDDGGRRTVWPSKDNGDGGGNGRAKGTPSVKADDAVAGGTPAAGTKRSPKDEDGKNGKNGENGKPGRSPSHLPGKKKRS